MRPRRPVTIWLPDGPQRAPEVTREWPADGPGRAGPPSTIAPGPAKGPRVTSSVLVDPFLPAAAAVVLVVVAAFAACLLSGLAPVGAGAAAFLAGAAAAIAVGRRAPRDPVGVLTRAQNALILGDDLRRVLGRLKGLEASGRAGMRLGVARRCLERAGRHGRLEESLRWEAVRWLGMTLDEISKDVKQ